MRKRGQGEGEGNGALGLPIDPSGPQASCSTTCTAGASAEPSFGDGVRCGAIRRPGLRQGRNPLWPAPAPPRAAGARTHESEIWRVNPKSVDWFGLFLEAAMFFINPCLRVTMVLSYVKSTRFCSSTNSLSRSEPQLGMVCGIMAQGSESKARIHDKDKMRKETMHDKSQHENIIVYCFRPTWFRTMTKGAPSHRPFGVEDTSFEDYPY